MSIVLFGTLIALWLLLSLKVLKEYEWGVIFRRGELLPKALGPGLVVVAWPVDRMVRVSLKTIVLEVPSQEPIGRADVPVRIKAMVHFRVTDSLKAVARTGHDSQATAETGCTTLPSRLGQDHLDALRSERERLGALLQEVIDRHADARVGKVSEMAIKAVVDVPQALKRVMADQAAREREVRAHAAPAEHSDPEPRSLELRSPESDSSVAFPIPGDWLTALFASSETRAFTVASPNEQG
jgi:regulator of protease activity HflC (stomatin/prohibitin superfamily)